MRLLLAAFLQQAKVLVDRSGHAAARFVGIEGGTSGPGQGSWRTVAVIRVPLHLYIVPESLSAAVALEESLRCVTTNCVPEKSAFTGAYLLAAIHMALMGFVGVRLIAAGR